MVLPIEVLNGGHALYVESGLCFRAQNLLKFTRAATVSAELSVFKSGIHLHQVFDLVYAAARAKAGTVSTTTPHVVFWIFYHR